MTTAQAAEYLRVAPVTLRRWNRCGKLVPYRIGKRNDRVYTVELINLFIERHYDRAFAL